MLLGGVCQLARGPTRARALTNVNNCVRTGNGGGAFDIGGNYIEGSVALKTGRDEDLLDIHDNWIGQDLSVDTGNGDDNVDINERPSDEDSYVGGDLKVKTGKGDDFVWLGDYKGCAVGVEVAGRSIFSGGGDTDDLDIFGNFNTFWIEPKISGFETVT